MHDSTRPAEVTFLPSADFWSSTLLAAILRRHEQLRGVRPVDRVGQVTQTEIPGQRGRGENGLHGWYLRMRERTVWAGCAPDRSARRTR